MRILAVNGSHRGSRGATQHLIDLLWDGAREAGAEFETVVLSKHKLQRCLGCFACATRHPLRCVYEGKDEVASIYQRMREADLLIYATPIYVFGISSLLKAFLERFMSTATCEDFRVAQSGLLFHHIDRALCSKPFVALVCCDNLEDETPRNAVEYFRTFSRFMDAPLAGTLVRHTAQGLMQAREPSGANRFPRAADVFAAYRQAGRELALHGKVARSTEKRASRSILEIPLPVRLLMKLNVRFIKQQAAKKAQGLVPAAPSEPASLPLDEQ